MKVAEALIDSRAFDTSGRLAYELRGGGRYVLHDPEAEAGESAGALRTLYPLDQLLPRYGGQALGGERLLAPHIGGLGDGITMASCLHALQTRYPYCEIEVSCPPVHHPLLNMLDAGFGPVAYPTPADELRRFAYYLSLEDVDGHAIDPGMSNIQVFGRCLRTPEATEPVRLRVPAQVIEACSLDSIGHPRVGIALTRSAHMRAYPVDLVLELARALLELGVAVLWFGNSGEIGTVLPHAPPMLCSLIDQTPGVAELAAFIAQLDVLVCPDSFFMHLAGALRVPSLAIFSSSATTVAGGYPTLHPVTAEVPCRPCGAIADRCPLGHAECIVHRHPSLNPRRLAGLAQQLLKLSSTTSSQPR